MNVAALIIQKTIFSNCQQRRKYLARERAEWKGLNLFPFIQFSWINIGANLWRIFVEKFQAVSSSSGMKRVVVNRLAFKYSRNNYNVVFLAFWLAHVLDETMINCQFVGKTFPKIFWNDKKSAYTCAFNPLSLVQNHYGLIILWKSKIDWSESLDGMEWIKTALSLRNVWWFQQSEINSK